MDAKTLNAETASPFAHFTGVPERNDLRRAITAAYRRPEEECVPALLQKARMTDAEKAETAALAARLVRGLRQSTDHGGVQGLVHEYSLSSAEGVALMCLAEALLRVPDRQTRDALIRDKIAGGDWRAHVGRSPSLFVNAATWGLVVTGKLTHTTSEDTLSSALTRLIGRSGEPVIRKGVDIAMRLMGEQFVTGQTIEEALKRSVPLEAKGYQYSYDMLGEAATTAHDAERYLADYVAAIHAIGKANAGRGVYAGPGISIKLSALHPRYARLKRDRVLHELLPRVRDLARLAKGYDIGLNIDAEEADRLELSLEILESLAFDPDLAGWNGIGFVIQAYQKRCPAVIDWVIDLAQRAGRRLMIRLVKGAYWDSEIKRAQVDGLEDFPVYTRKVHTDLSYLACARKLLAAREHVFPQFATHNAHSLASVMTMAGPDFKIGDYEFQCLHGMGEPLYDQVVGKDKLNRPCRIYAPVGTHETLLAYLVRRLLENGANSSFVNRIADESVPVEELTVHPADVVEAESPVGRPHDKILSPRRLYGAERNNSAGLDLSNENTLAALRSALEESAEMDWMALPTGATLESGAVDPVRNPADHDDIVGYVRFATRDEVDQALATASSAAPRWADTAVARRAEILEAAANAMEARMPVLIGLIVREAGKSYLNAIAEVREAVDFLRYYPVQARKDFAGLGDRPLGAITCISPWNFPLAIFCGQIAAALAAGNTVLAKPAEETPLIAAEAVRILHAAGIPEDVLHILPGAGEVGAALVGDARTRGVMFTGSTEVARLIQKQLADRLNPDGKPVPLIAETGGQNALIVDSTALPEQVVGDVIASAFDSAGQRCSALRVLCLQSDIADRTLAMLKGALDELSVGNPVELATDIGPVISAEARTTIENHIASMASKGHKVSRHSLGEATENGTFVAPTIIEIGSIADLGREVFGPVLHVVRFKREALDALIDQINATGYGLTFGLHTRIDETIERVVERVEAGNIYVNRNIIGAVVGVQPFGGSGLSGTGPKAGGPLYMKRLVTAVGGRAQRPLSSRQSYGPGQTYIDWLKGHGHRRSAAQCSDFLKASALGTEVELPGPVGETNLYRLTPRGNVAVIADDEDDILAQIGAVLATGNRAVIERSDDIALLHANLPADIAARIEVVDRWDQAPDLAAALVSGSEEDILAASRKAAARDGMIVPVHAISRSEIYPIDLLLEERSISINTAAAGGNANLMTIG